jgi:hypothetical protein
MRNAKSAVVLYAGKGVHTLFTGQRERVFLKGMAGAIIVI